MIDNCLFSEAHEAAGALATVLDASAEYAILCEDEQGTITHWNEGARRLYSFDPDEVAVAHWVEAWKLVGASRGGYTAFGRTRC